MLIMNKWKLNWVNCGCVVIPVLVLGGGVGFLLVLAIGASRIEYGWGAGGHYDGLQRYANRTPQWSADGQTLVVNLGDEIYGASVDGNRLWRIVAYKDPEYDYSGVFKPSLSVNGEVAYIEYHRDEGLFARSYPDKHHIKLTDINGTETKQMFSKSGVANYSPNWSPDGSRLAFTTYDPSDGYQIIVMAKREFGLPSILTFWKKYDTHSITSVDKKQSSRRLVWSNDNQRFAYVVSSEQPKIVNARWDGADEKIAMEQERRIGAFDPTSLTWSPADDRIYFVYYELMDGEDAGYAPSVRSVRPDGSDERIIAAWWEGFRVKGLKLSSDGSQLLFTTHRSPKDNVRRLSDDLLYVMSADGSEAKKVFDPVDIYRSIGRTDIYASWSTDGSRIAVHDLGHGGNVFTISPDGADARLVIGPGVQPGYGKPLPEAAGR